jgi:outer membrane protein insertion porin family
MKWLLVLVLAMPGIGAAQARGARPAQKKAEAPAPTKWPIISLQVAGNRNYSSEQVLAVAGLKVGQLAGKEEFDAARDRLVASGFFEMVGYRFAPAPGNDGSVATFEVTEVDAAYPARFEGLGVPGQELEGLLRSRDPLFSASKIPPTKPVLDRYVAWIQEYLTSKGSPEKVAAKMNPIGPERFEIVFRPARNLPSVAQVTFEGNRVVTQTVLRDAISGVAVGSPYTEEHFRELLNTSVRPVYEARGRVRVSFSKVRTEPTKDVQGLHVFVTVDEGESYGLGKVAIAGPTPVKPDDLLKAAKIETGDVANFDRVNEGLERIRQAVARSGFLDAKVTAERMIDDAKKTVDVAVNIEPGPQYLMGKLNTVGLDLNADFEIKRLWTMKEGKPFNVEYPNFFLNSVRERGVFDNLGQTKSETKINADHTVDVTLTFGGQGPPKKQDKRFGQ